MINFYSSSLSDVGKVRKLNEDSFLSRDDLGLWVVADGMGGHQAGDMASQSVVAALDRVNFCPDIDGLIYATQAAINEANSYLISVSSQYDANRVPGSTVVALVISGDAAAIVWAGDSRIYQFRNGAAAQISKDHSHVQELVDQGLIAAEDAESHPMSNVITRAIGIDIDVELDVMRFNVVDGDRFVLCSDGLSKLLTIDEIHALINTAGLEQGVRSLVSMALDRGAPDNVTVIAVECVDESNQDEETTRMLPT